MKKIFVLLWLMISTVYAAKPLHVVVTLPVGSGSDQHARQWVKKYDETYGTVSTVVNKPGGDGVIGFKYFLSLNKDNASGIPVLHPAIAHYVGYEGAERNDVIPLFEGSRTPFVLIVRKNLPVNTWKEWVDYNRKRPSEVNQGIMIRGWFGAIDHIQEQSGISPNTIFYTGNSRSEIDVAGGSLDAAWTLAPNFFGSGIEDRVRLIAISSTSAVSGMDSSGVLGRNPKIGSWFIQQGFFVSTALPEDTKQQLFNRLKALRDTQWAKETFNKSSMQVGQGSSEDFSRDLEKFRQKVKK
jgi:tripartite-type tricarboxylate transporter receptor subunit TctC